MLARITGGHLASSCSRPVVHNRVVTRPPPLFRRGISTIPTRRAQAAAMPLTQPSTAEIFYPQPSAPSPAPATSHATKDEFWRRIPMWKDVSVEDFISYEWSRKNVIEHHKRSRDGFRNVLSAVLPDFVPYDESGATMQSREDLINDIFQGIAEATMSIRLMPHIFSRINWNKPRQDPIFRQFIPMKSTMLPDHPMLTLDSLDENADSAVDGLVHRYPDKALFLPISVCPTYCTFCTRSYAVGADTGELSKQTMKPILRRWEKAFAYIESQPGLHDIVVSGGDAYYLTPEQLAYIGERLIGMRNITKFRFASKGLAVCPNRFIDPKDGWTDALIWVNDKAMKAGKRMALHTHFNHPNEISWITEQASRRLVEAGVTIRNQTVLLRGVNDNVQIMGSLIRKLADTLRIRPYYVYQCDLVKKVEHLRTPLQTILDMETQLRGSIAGFDFPHFIVDLPGGGGKRDAWSHLSYDRKTGVSKFVAPAVQGRDKAGKVYKYFDPILKPEGC